MTECEALQDIVCKVGVLTYGKERWFKQNGCWYDRMNGDYIQNEILVERVCIELDEEYTDYKTKPQYHADIECNYKDCDNCGHREYCPQSKTKPQTEHLEQFRVGLEYHTDNTHFGKVKGESITTNKVEDKPQTEVEVIACPIIDDDAWIYKDELQTYITEDRDTQILDAWQVHNRSTTSVKGKP